MTQFHQSGRRDVYCGGKPPQTVWQRERAAGPLIPLAQPRPSFWQRFSKWRH